MNARRDITIELSRDGKQPIFLDIVASIVREIERGRLKPGEALPGTRALARSLKVHRNTVDAAYHELTMQGWLVAEPSRGTFVARDLPDLRPANDADRKSAPANAVRTEMRAPSPLRVTDGAPDSRLMPRSELGRAFRRALLGPAFLSDTGYGDPRGALSLREALSDYLESERGLIAPPSDLLVTRGSQMGLFLAASAVIEPGEAIAVEDPGYPLAWAAFRAAGAKVIGVPVDGQGIDVSRLASIADREPRLRAIYVTPHHQYPTTVTLGAGRRLKLLDIARYRSLTIIEDDYDHEYRFDGRPVLPLAVRAEVELPVIYIGSLSKLLAPAVRVGYVTARSDILARMVDRREAIDRQGDLPLEQALAGLIEDGALRRHARKARRIYQARRDHLAERLISRLGSEVTFETPAGGLALWISLRSGLSAETWAFNAHRAGLAVTPGLRFALDASRAPEAFRVGYASLDQSELSRLVDLLSRTRPD
ncbi:PLP-dependent aminotransferase family protein [Ensifer adhaerens]|uniref:MocR-like pyridoxine biosynthesis transcription factor PdxR n=1 Tax=Ensifer adhaerens TaxID=106592 RepID=UPI001CBD99E8|nr:PLP-dependent aminotransferase family protein [Ensifer adhaerens]MBZ7921470.1 PLP-dependent aminotransferase family protein [Ensifer adhaerens]UAX93895.1 PLP-dependent aminotransferase family protein [Ensifer adhaerens]UAY01530.1 PLP-dependent aminotransferase family protein [Ensifer adhaerens]UAY08913.1 PLP-dependent aminotransferase family protein [Ensifer adhaerens]